MRTFLDHVLDNGGTYSVDSVSVMCDLDPITIEFLEPSQRYYIVTVVLGTEYYYLVPSENTPDEETIGKTIRRYSKNPQPGGRDWLSFIDVDHPQSLKNDKVRAALSEMGVVPEPKSMTSPSKTVKPKFSIEDLL